MTINGYDKTFEELVSQELPIFMNVISSEMKKNIPMDLFARKGFGVVSICNELGLENDLSGCYVMHQRGKPIYVGISRKVLFRLRQHVLGKTHFDASLAYRMAAGVSPHDKTRAAAMESEKFHDEFLLAKEYIRGLDVAFVQIENPLALYVFEPYCSMKLGAAKWNKFETH